MVYWFLLFFLSENKDEHLGVLISSRIAFFVLSLTSFALGGWVVTEYRDALTGLWIFLFAFASVCAIILILSFVLSRLHSYLSARRVMRDTTPSKPVLRYDIEREQKERNRKIYEEQMKHREEVLRRIEEARKEEEVAKSNKTSDPEENFNKE